MKFGVIADCQYADIDGVDYAPERKFRMSPRKLTEAIDFFNTQELDFVVNLGDIIDQDMASFETIMPVFAGSKHELLHVLGNHDFYASDDNDPQRNSCDELVKVLNMPASYYSKTYGDYCCIFLDSNEVGVIEPLHESKEYKAGLKLIKSLEEKGYVNAHRWNGTLSETQMQWLHRQLVTAQNSRQKVILFAHHGIFPEHKDNMLEYEKILSLFTDYKNIIAYMNGHNHDGSRGIYNDVPCITFRGMVDTEENSYAVVEVQSNKMQIMGFGREKSQLYKTKTS